MSFWTVFVLQSINLAEYSHTCVKSTAPPIYSCLAHNLSISTICNMRCVISDLNPTQTLTHNPDTNSNLMLILNPAELRSAFCKLCRLTNCCMRELTQHCMSGPAVLYPWKHTWNPNYRSRDVNSI